jgi:hypothetical protein
MKKNNQRASDEVLSSLHNVLAQDLLRRIQSGEATPAELNAAIKFLQNNGIEAVNQEDSPLAALAASLPQFNDEDEERVH